MSASNKGSNNNADIDSLLDELDRQERTDFFGSFGHQPENQPQNFQVACKPGVASLVADEDNHPHGQPGPVPYQPTVRNEQQLSAGSATATPSFVDDDIALLSFYDDDDKASHNDVANSQLRRDLQTNGAASSISVVLPTLSRTHAMAEQISNGEADRPFSRDADSPPVSNAALHANNADNTNSHASSNGLAFVTSSVTDAAELISIPNLSQLDDADLQHRLLFDYFLASVPGSDINSSNGCADSNFNLLSEFEFDNNVSASNFAAAAPPDQPVPASSPPSPSPPPAAAIAVEQPLLLSLATTLSDAAAAGETEKSVDSERESVPARGNSSDDVGVDAEFPNLSVLSHNIGSQSKAFGMGAVVEKLDATDVSSSWLKQSSGGVDGSKKSDNSLPNESAIIINAVDLAAQKPASSVMNEEANFDAKSRQADENAADNFSADSPESSSIAASLAASIEQPQQQEVELYRPAAEAADADVGPFRQQQKLPDDEEQQSKRNAAVIWPSSSTTPQTVEEDENDDDDDDEDAPSTNITEYVFPPSQPSATEQLEEEIEIDMHASADKPDENIHEDDAFASTSAAAVAAAAVVTLGRARHHIHAPNIDDTQIDTYLKSDFLTPKIDDQQSSWTTVKAEDESQTSSTAVAASSKLPVTNTTGWLGTTPGAQAPEWVPDEMAPLCMSCGLKFTLVRRRHHCRCCGRVLCNQCCNSRAKLAYLPAAQKNEARVCAQCCADLLQCMFSTMPNETKIEAPKASAENVSERLGTLVGGETENVAVQEKNENAAENDAQCSTLTKPRAISNVSTPSAAVASATSTRSRSGGTNSILKRPNTTTPSSSLPATSTSTAIERRSVMFSDGIRPGGDLAEMYSSPPRSKPYARMKRSRAPSSLCAKPSHLRSCPTFIDKTVLPVTDASVAGGHRLNQSFGREEITKYFSPSSVAENSAAAALEFAVSTDVRVTCHCSTLKFWHATRQVWCFATRGLRTVGQNEFIFLLERDEIEDLLPPHDVFRLVHDVYARVCTGKEQPIGEYGVVVLPQKNSTSAVGGGVSAKANNDESSFFLGRREIGGVIFVRPTNLQSLAGVAPLPEAPFLAALLVMKYEMPWARHFPLRLILSLGAKSQYYPCPLVNVRERDCALGAAGDNAQATIMSLLCDFRYFKYTLPRIPGAYCIISTTHNSSNMPSNENENDDSENNNNSYAASSSSSSSSSFQNSSVTFSLPKSHYESVMHVLGTSADNVLAFGTDFVDDRKRASAHLVAVQYDSDDGAPGGQFETRAVGPSSNFSDADAESLLSSNNNNNNTVAALFVVFNRKLKDSSAAKLDDKCRLSIVEDGVMIEITSDAFDHLKASLKKMANVKYDIILSAASEDAETPNSVSIAWVDDDVQEVDDGGLSISCFSNAGVVSPIDGRSLSTYKSQRVHMQDSTDYINGRQACRCTEVFFLRPTTIPLTNNNNTPDLARLINLLAQAVCRAVQSYLIELRGAAASGPVSLFSVRTNLQTAAEVRSYEIGANGAALEMPQILSKLDELLIPVLYGVQQQQQQPSTENVNSPAVVATSSSSNINCQLELFFRII